MGESFEVLKEAVANKLIKTGWHPKPLGYQKPKDYEHVESHPISALLAEGITIPKVPITLGVDWYSDFDNPVAYQFKTVFGTTVTRWIVAKNGLRGNIRGGHCICIKPGNRSDPLEWWDFYDQGSEGACVGFGHSRMQSLLNRKRYNARWLWDWAKKVDEWPDTNPGDDNGTSCHAAMSILKSKGHVSWASNMASMSWQTRDKLIPTLTEGVSAYRWATSVDEVRAVLTSDLNEKMQAVPFLNSWGRFYPHITWMPYTVLQKLMDDGGEVGIPTDR